MKTNLAIVDENFEQETKKKIICSKADWLRMDKEKELKKEYQERLSKPLGKKAKWVWVGILANNK
ncbi:hypothetical protein [uncultured Mediterranean phage]|nr:hypothetical protein [uncultured Mediterranean phage]